jgi:hypothetical protein|tara:strand:- start:26 stop:400 length:375 start_codon:yes stop_codon:yes gene_type:complete
MIERYRRHAATLAASTNTTLLTVTNDGESTPSASETVIIGFLIASTQNTAQTVTVTLTDYYDGTVRKLVDGIPLLANSSVDICPGKMVLMHGLNNASTPVLTGDIIKVQSSGTTDVVLSVVERV